MANDLYTRFKYFSAMSLARKYHDAQNIHRNLLIWAITTGDFLDAERIRIRAVDAQRQSADYYAKARLIREIMNEK